MEKYRSRKRNGRERSPPVESKPMESKTETVIKTILSNERVQALFKEVATLKREFMYGLMTSEEEALRSELIDIIGETHGFDRLSLEEKQDVDKFILFSFLEYRNVCSKEQFPIPRNKHDLVTIRKRNRIWEMERIQKEMIPLFNADVPGHYEYDDFISDVLTPSEVAEQFIKAGLGYLVIDYFMYLEGNPDEAQFLLEEEATPSATLLNVLSKTLSEVDWGAGDDHHFIRKLISYPPEYYSKPWFQKFVLALLQKGWVSLAERIIDLVGDEHLHLHDVNTEVIGLAAGILKELGSEAVEQGREIVRKSGFFVLSEKDFRENFLFVEGEASLEQSKDVGNCYLVAVLEALRRWPHFELVCRSSVTKNKDGSWTVLIPFMNKEGSSVTVTEKELGPDSKGMSPLKGPKGFQVLETAFIKKTYGKVFRKLSHGGDERDPLSFFTSSIFAVRVSHNPREILATLNLGIHLATVSKGGEGVETETDITATSWRRDSNGFLHDSQPENLHTNHAYVVSHKGKDEETVFLVNPHDTGRVLEVTYEQFEQFSDTIVMARINNEVLFQWIDDLEEKVEKQ